MGEGEEVINGGATTNKLSRLERAMLFLSFISVQMVDGRYFSLAFLILFILLNVLRSAKHCTKVDRRNVLAAWLWGLLVVNLVRFNQQFTVEGYIQLSWLIVGFGILLSSFLMSRVEADSGMSILVTTTSIMGALAIVGYFSSVEITHVLAPPYAGTRIVGGFDGPNEVAAFNLLVFAYSLNMQMGKRADRKYLFSIVITTLVIILSFSRGAYIGWASVTVLSLLVYLSKRMSVRKIIVVALILLSSTVMVNRYVAPALNEIRRNASDRTDMMSSIMEPIYRKPLYGWGVGSISSNSSVRNSTPHNGYIYILYAGGAVALTLYSAFHGIIVLELLRSRKVALTAMYFAFMTQEMFFNNLIRGRLSLVFWMLVLLVFLGRASSAKSRKPVQRDLLHENSGGRRGFCEDAIAQDTLIVR